MRQMEEIVDDEPPRRRRSRWRPFRRNLLREAKRIGTSDEQLAQMWKTTPAAVRHRAHKAHVAPVFKRVDTCAAEFESFTPYLYSTYEDEDEADTTDRPKIVILGSGPNRIGQGIEFDYCCCHASFALREDGYETIMVNCNPETVSTDYDTSDRLYFEPLTLEDVLAVVEREKPQGVIVQFGGQTPLNLALDLKRNGVPIIGTAPESIDLAEDRRRFGRLLDELGIPQPRNGTALVPEEAVRVAKEIGLPGAGAPELRAGRPRHGDRLRPADGAGIRGAGGADGSGAPGADRSVPRRSHRSGRGRARRRRNAWSSAASWSTSKRPACTRAIPPACCRRCRCRLRCWRAFATTPSAWRKRSTWSA